MAKTTNNKPEPPHALPAPAAAEKPGKAPPTNNSAPPEKEPSWFIRGAAALGGFLAGVAAGVTAGYAFCKAEGKFTAFGESLLGQLTKGWAKTGDRGGYAAARRPAWREGSPDFSDRGPRRSYDPGNDPMGESSGSDVQEDDQL